MLIATYVLNLPVNHIVELQYLVFRLDEMGDPSYYNLQMSIESLIVSVVFS